MYRGAEEKSEILTIPNRYKVTLDDFIDNLDLESPDWLELINEGSRNVAKSAGSLTGSLKRSCLDKNVSDCRSAWQAPETGESQVHQHCDVAPLDHMSRKEHYGKCEKDEKDWKDQRGRESY